MQHLIDVRNQLDRYASPDKVDWHLACISNRWTKRALTSAGFGYPAPLGDTNAPVFERWKPVFSVAEIGGEDSAANAAEVVENERTLRRQRTRDVEEAHASGSSQPLHASSKADEKDNIAVAASTAEHGSHSSESDFRRSLSASKPYAKGATAKVAVVHGLNRPLFHVDLTSALQSAVANVERREGGKG